MKCLSLTLCSYFQVSLKVLLLLSLVRCFCGGVIYTSFTIWQEKSGVCRSSGVWEWSRGSECTFRVNRLLALMASRMEDSLFRTWFALWAVALSTPECSCDPQIHKAFTVKRLCEIVPSVDGIIIHWDDSRQASSTAPLLKVILICDFCILELFQMSLNLFPCVEWICAQHI